MVVVRVSIVILAAFLFAAAAFTAWNAAMFGDTAIPPRAGAWFFLGVALVSVDLALARVTERR